MKNKDSYQLLQEREAALQKNRNQILGGDNIKRALNHAKNHRQLEFIQIKKDSFIMKKNFDLIIRFQRRNGITGQKEQELFKMKRFKNAESYVKQMRQGDYSYLERNYHHHQRSVDRLEPINGSRNSYIENENNPNISNIKKPRQENRSLSNNQRYKYNSVNSLEDSTDEIHSNSLEAINKNGGRKIVNYSSGNQSQSDMTSHRQESTELKLPMIRQRQEPDKRLLSDDERRNIILDFQQRRKDLFQQLNRMPIANITKAHQELIREIESEIDETEAAIKMFSSRKPVYVSTQNNTFTHD
ncbi:UNKNOWN [Stylonychia lemnae]|uniref:Enkurin domain-containing protein n=1 Tax=Stylonychia lemnae TaxID=5949 RepID=A0A077ZTG4_STYLE|nr:UNKNOWN [Stylonychia lemnae]|eukprot:CDW73203.1 UNKNOWN [Stylonychia lemnae]